MPPSLLHLPDELLLLVLSFIPAQITYIPDSFWRKQRNPDVDNLSRCSRRLHAVATPVLYASIVVGDKMPLLLRSLMYNRHLRSYTQSLTLSIPETEKLWSYEYFENDADEKLLRTTIEEILRDEVWHQPPPEGWCGGKLHTHGFRADYAALRWFAAVYSVYDHWNAQCALLLALMPGLTHLEFYTGDSGLRLNGMESHESDYITFLMLAAANTQLRALAAAANPVRAPKNAADGVLPRLRCVSTAGDESWIKVQDLLPLALPPLVEELRVSGYEWSLSQTCADCATQMRLNVRSLVISANDITMPQFHNLLGCFPKLEKLIGGPGSVVEFDEPPTMLQALGSAAGTLKKLDLSDDVWPYPYHHTSEVPCGPLCDFPVLEKVGISAERLIAYWEIERKAPPKQMLLGHFPASLKELTITGRAPALEIVRALPYLLDTHEVPALQLVTVVLEERYRHDELVVDVRRQCEARGIGFALPLVNRMHKYPHWCFGDDLVFHPL